MRLLYDKKKELLIASENWRETQRRLLRCSPFTLTHTCDCASDVLTKRCKTLVTLQYDQSYPRWHHSPSSLSLANTHAHTRLFQQRAASKLRCAHGRAGTWKTKANMQAHFWLERITRFTQPSFSCSEKANVEWNRRCVHTHFTETHTHRPSHDDK